MSISGIACVMSAPPSRWSPYQPASTSTYSRPNSAAKSMKWRNVSLFMPAFHGTFGTTGPLHQSQATLPGLIHEVSPISLGSARLVRIVDSTRSPGFAPSMSTRQGETRGRAPRTTMSGCEGSGASFVTSVGWRESFPPSTRAKCRPDHFRRLASASATTRPSPASIVSGGPTIDSGLMPRSGMGTNSRSLLVVNDASCSTQALWSARKRKRVSSETTSTRSRPGCCGST